MSAPHHLGWRHDLEPAAKAAWAAAHWSDRPRCAVSLDSTALAGDTRPLPDGFALLDLLYWWHNQGPVGSCFSNGGSHSSALTTAVAVKGGEPFALYQPSRAFIWATCRMLDGSFGSGGDGGSITNTLRAMTESGVPPEELCPYRPDHRWLDRRPSAEAYAAAAKNKLTGYAAVDYRDTEARKRLIYNGTPYVVGIWWPYGWDGNQIDQYGRTRGIGPGQYGHALVDVGWFVWDGVLHWIRLNSHGPIYPLPPAEVRAAIPGYATAPGHPTKNYAFFVNTQHDLSVFGYGYSECVAPVGVSGLVVREPATWQRAFSS